MNIVIFDGYTINPGDLSWKKITSIGKEHSLHFFPTFHQNACHKSFKWNLRKHYYGISLGSVSNYILSLLYLTG